MRTCDVIEQICVDQLQPTHRVINQLIDAYTSDAWIRLADQFLRGLDRTHQVPGRVVYQMRDICAQVQEGQPATRDQIWWLFHNLCEHWNNLSALARAEMML